MAELPTFSELYSAAKAEIQSRNPALTDFNDGSVLDAFAGASSVLADEVARVLVDLFAEQFFATASGSALDDLAFDRLGLIRQPAGQATATLTWTRVAAGTYTIPAGTSFSATNSLGSTVTFSSVADVSVGVGDSTVSVVVVADEAGRASNVDVGTITTILDSVTADPTATVTNAARAAGGSPAWTDEQFRDYIRSYYVSLRRGTRGALRTGALSVAGVAVVTVEEVDGLGVNVYVGDPDGAGNATLADAVALELENWRSAGVLVSVFPTTREEPAISIEVTLTEAPADLTALTSDIKAALVAYTDTLAAGEVAYATEMSYAIKAADEFRILSITGLSNLTPAAATNAIRLTTGNISVSFVEEG